MAFDNKTMPTKVSGKPHIAMIDGWWRVSSIRWKRQVYGRVPTGAPQVAHDRWNAANRFIQPLNRDLHWCKACFQRVRR